MSDEKSGSDAPEFVAVTPRGVVPEPTPTEPEPEPTTQVEAPEASEASAPAQSDVTDAAEPESEEAPAAAEPPAPDDATSPDPAAGDATEPERAEAEAEAPAPEPEPASPTADEPAKPAAALQWSAPTLERTPPAAEGAAAGDTSAEPAPAGEGNVEVSVRVAAEGMAAALSGDASTPAEEPAEPARAVGPLALATAVCAVLAIAAGVLLAVTARSNSNHAAVAAARVAALDAAKRETALALTYNYKTLDADFQRAEAGMSRRFRASYAETAATSVTPLATQTHAVSTGTVAAGGVVSATPNAARVLVFANQVVENQRLNATSRLDRSVIDVRMVKENGRWVIDDLQPF